MRADLKGEAMDLRDENVFEARAELARHMARTVHLLAWADFHEEQGTLPGQCEIDDVAPPTTLAATVWADAVERQITGDILEAYARADRYGSVARLGHCLTMEACGTGVTWEDDYAPHGLTVPYVEQLYYFDSADAGDDQ